MRSFYWLSGVKWIRMWSHRPWLRLLTKPTLILSGSICQGSHNFVDLSCINMQSWARGVSDMKRLQTSLRSTMTDERLSSLSILHIHKHKDVIHIDGIITEFACLKGTHPAYFWSPPWWRHCFTLFCRKHCSTLPITIQMGKINN